MATRWKCDQCGTTTRTGMIASLQGGPESCENCQSVQFSEINTTGVIHESLESILAWAQGLPVVGPVVSTGSDDTERSGDSERSGDTERSGGTGD